MPSNRPRLDYAAKHKICGAARKTRRSKWAADLEHLVPGGKRLTDDQLELWLDLMRRPRR